MFFLFISLFFFNRHQQVDCTLFFFFSFFVSFMHACYSIIPPFSWSSIFTFNVQFFVNIYIYTYMSPRSLHSPRVLSSDYSAKPCLNSYPQTKKKKKKSSFTQTRINQSWKYHRNMSIVIFMCSNVLFLLVFLRHSFVCHLSSFVHATLLLKKIIYIHINSTITYYFYLFVAFCFSIFFFFFSFIHKHFCRRHARSLLFVLDLWFFLYVLTVLSLSTSVCLFDWFFFYISFCVFLFFPR